MTYVATNEIYLPAAEIPLSTTFGQDFLPPTIVGAVLEQQTASLEGSKWKPATREAISVILSAALGIYDAQEMPVRRARVLVKCLEYAYHEDPTAISSHGYLGRQAEDILKEIQGLLVKEVSSALHASRDQ